MKYLYKCMQVWKSQVFQKQFQSQKRNMDKI